MQMPIGTYWAVSIENPFETVYFYVRQYGIYAVTSLKMTCISKKLIKSKLRKYKQRDELCSVPYEIHFVWKDCIDQF